MAFHVPKAPGMAQMLKEGARYFSGLEEAVYGNISACKQFAQTVRTAYGPNGMNKMIINHIEKLFITNDAATIINELEVEHPAAKLIVLASKMQEAEVGDGTNFVIIFAGALLEAAEELLRLGITTSEIVEGYEASLEKVLQILPTLVCYEIKDYKDEKQIKMGIKTAIMSKQYGNEEPLTSLVAQACISILPKKSTFNVDNVRVCKILGSGISSSEVVQGMVFKRQVEGDVTKKDNSKIAVYTCAVDIIQTGLEQYAVRRFATALEVFPKTLAENSGSYASELLSKLYSAHKEGKKNYGFNIDQKGGLIDTVESGILDLFLTKQWGLKYAVGVACTVLKVNQIIMAKRAGGPKVPGGGIRDDDE